MNRRSAIVITEVAKDIKQLLIKKGFKRVQHSGDYVTHVRNGVIFTEKHLSKYENAEQLLERFPFINTNHAV